MTPIVSMVKRISWFLTWGALGRRLLSEVHALTDVTPAIVRLSR